ncbi:MAG: isocitrate lyase/phosphoenolpyruvate mutase family protein, partial [Acidimicrobiales bacterium]|nr:isocitrate lyase/phosphoenolpyruvate mutase family protein [Acidimicrobiales bacterium]
MIQRFRELHTSGCFVMPNPWDRGSAQIMEQLGFKALATSSSAHARSLGKSDQELTRDELLTHVADLTGFIGVPLNVDSERLYPNEPGGIERTVELLASAGA